LPKIVPPIETRFYMKLGGFSVNGLFEFYLEITVFINHFIVSNHGLVNLKNFAKSP